MACKQGCDDDRKGSPVKKVAEARARLSDKISDEYNKKQEECKGDHITLGDNGKLYIKEVLHKFYPNELHEGIMFNVKANTYFIKQFSMDIKNINNGGSNDDSVTYTGNTDKSCLNISKNSSLIASYSINGNGTTEYCIRF